MRILSSLLRRPAPLVGIDIGSSSVKAVELTRSAGGEAVATVGVEAVPAECIVEGAIVDRAAVAEAVRRVLAAAGIRGRDVALSLPGSAVVARRLTLPQMSPAELAGSISWEAERLIPFDLRDVNLDYQVVGRARDADRRTSMVVLLAAAKKSSIAEYAAAVAEAGCAAVVVDVAAFALQNAYLMSGGPDGGDSVALLNAGASTINVNIVRDGCSVFTRDIAFGGNAYTEALRTARAISFEEAETLKKSGGSGRENLEESEPVVREVTENLLMEVEKTFDFFTAGQDSGRLHRIVMSGGAARGRGFAAAMERRFEAALEWFDPFRRMTIGSMSAPGREPDEVSARAGVATGLALRRAGDR